MKAEITDWMAPNYTEVYRERAARLQKIKDNDAWDLAFAYYKTRPIEAIEDWLFTYDPRNIPLGRSPYVPFMLMPRQREYILWLLERWNKQESGVVEKSRDMGISWLGLGFSWWLWTFYPGASITMGSRKEALVDKVGDADSLLEKFRLMMRRVPKGFVPNGFVEKKHATHLKINNPENEAALTGEAGDQMGRGGRSSIYFLDEFAFVERSNGVDAAVSQNSGIRIYQSTVNGTGNAFAVKAHDGHHPVFRFHWTDDPRKDVKWYETQCLLLEPETVASEIDINYEASDDLIAISPAWVRASQELYTEMKGKPLIDLMERLKAENVPKISGCDVAAGGSASNIFVIRWGPIISKTQELRTDDLINAAGWMRGLSEENGCTFARYDCIGVGKGVQSAFKRWKYPAEAINVGVPASRAKWPDKKRSVDKFQNLKGELWWMIRERLRKTAQHVAWMRGEEGQKHDLVDLLLIPPSETQLARELGVVKAKYMDSGKIQIESKISLKARGVASPDRAEAVILTEKPKKRGFRVRKTTGIW